MRPWRRPGLLRALNLRHRTTRTSTMGAVPSVPDVPVEDLKECAKSVFEVFVCVRRRLLLQWHHDSPPLAAA